MENPDILTSNVESIRSFVRGGMNLQDATEKFEQNLRLNGNTDELAKERASAAMGVLKPELDRVYDSGDPRVSTKL